MTPDDLLQSLREIPKPELSPFFAAKVERRASTRRNDGGLKAAAPWLRAYWLVLAFFAGGVLLQHWTGVVMIVCAAAVAALTPEPSPSR